VPGQRSRHARPRLHSRDTVGPPQHVCAAPSRAYTCTRRAHATRVRGYAARVLAARVLAAAGGAHQDSDGGLEEGDVALVLEVQVVLDPLCEASEQVNDTLDESVQKVQNRQSPRDSKGNIGPEAGEQGVYQKCNR
jgi:hypothetical protein